MTVKKFAVLFVHALVGWGLCGAIIGIFSGITSMDNTLIIHAIAVPIIFGLLSLLYFSRFNYTTPWQTAAFFFSFAVLMDFFVIAIFVEKSFAMFASILGTWIPFALIFFATYLVGTYILQQKRRLLAAG